MVKKLVIHIGAPKTGSSAIQTFLAANHEALRAQGFIVPDSTLGMTGQITGHQVWAFAKNTTDENKDRLHSLIDAIDREHKDDLSLVISAENLSEDNGHHLIFEDIAKKLAIDVILYIRRQDDYLISAWQQWYSKIHSDFWAWLLTVVGKMANWRDCLERWETITPRSNISVRVYEREKLVGGDVVLDFREILGLNSADTEFTMPKGRVNPTYAEAVADLARSSRGLFRDVHDNDFYNAVRDLTGDLFIRNARESLFTNAERKAIVGSYVASNSWVKVNYFPNISSELFRNVQRDQYQLISPSELERGKWGLVTAMLMGMYRRLPPRKI